AKFRAISQSATDAIISADSRGKIMIWNHGAEQIFGYSEEEILNKPLALLMPERFQEAHEKGFRRAAAGGETHIIGKTVEVSGIRKNGQEILLELSLARWEIDADIFFSAVIRDITERKQAEEELTKLSTAVKQSPSVIAITDTEGKLEYVNPIFTEITGYSREEVIGQNPRILKSGEHPAEMYKALWETISSGKTWRGEMYNKKKNGELFWEMASISPIFDAEGNIIRYIKVAEDITGQKRNEQIQSIIHNISNAVITSHSPENFLALVNDELGKLIDTTNFFVALYDEETDRISLPLHHDEKDKFETFPAGKTLTNYVIKTGKPLLARKAMIEKLIKSGEVEQVAHLSEVWLGVPLKSNNYVTGIFAVQNYDNENAYGEADVKMLEIISDQISLSLERLKAEEDLKIALEKAQESETKYRTLIESSNDAIYLLFERKFEVINKKFEQLFGYTLKEVNESNFDFINLVAPKSVPLIEDRAKRASNGEKLDSNYEFTAITKNGKELEVEASVTYIDYKDGIATQGIIRDITQRKQAEQQIQNDLKEKTLLLSEVHHRVKNSLQVVASLLQLQLRNITDQHILDLFQQSRNRIQMMAKVYEKLYQSKNFASIDYKDYLQDFLNNILRSSGLAHRISLKLQIKNIVLGLDDATPVALIINELFTNSLKHAFPGDRKGKIEINFQLSEDKTYQIIYRDNGVGLSEDADFDNAETLGLHLIKNLAKQVCGEATFEQNEWTTFKIIFKGYGKSKYSDR
ncbi:MAG: PAS domain S-box protein, partial [Candidatus Zixiibacteriota bacterium]